MTAQRNRDQVTRFLRDSAVHLQRAAAESDGPGGDPELAADYHERAELLDGLADRVSVGLTPERTAVEITGTHWRVDPDRLAGATKRHLENAVSAGRLAYEGRRVGRDWYRIIPATAEPATEPAHKANTAAAGGGDE